MSAQQKPILFEVASIRPSRKDEAFDQEVLQDGFLIRNSPVSRLIWYAYGPSGLFGVGQAYAEKAFDWAWEDQVDIVAKISPDEVERWKRETTAAWDSPTLKHALQVLLGDRYKLKAHSIPVEQDGFALVVKRQDMRTGLVPVVEALDHASKPSSTNIPRVAILPGGVIQFHDQPVSKLALWLSPFARTVVEDRTGLIGTYDFSIIDRQPIRPTAEETEDYRSPTERWDLQPLGLMLVRAKVRAIALVVDHIEPPSPN